MTERASVDVCVATYRRPELLGRLLTSLSRQELGGASMRVVVVDNDARGSARPTVEGLRAAFTRPLAYDVEPRQSIALARNRALGLVAADFVAFVDDDEEAPPAWLATLLGAAERYRADAVFGPVVSVLPASAPAWARRHAAFLPPPRPTGAVVRHGATNNCLLRTTALGSPSQAFDAAYGLTGGEDSDFFFRLHLAGRRLVWCAEAFVTESVPAYRLEERWLCRRAYRGGQSYYRVFVTRSGATHRAAWMFRELVQLCAAVAMAPAARMLSYRSYVELLARGCGAAGQLSAWIGLPLYEEYRAPVHR